MCTCADNMLRYVNQYDEEYDAVKKTRRPGRPASAREDLLKMKVDALQKEHQNGFCMLHITPRHRLPADWIASSSGPLKPRQSFSSREVGGILGLSCLPVLGSHIQDWQRQAVYIPTKRPVVLRDPPLLFSFSTFILHPGSDPTALSILRV